jgi:hypothetical protein
VIQKSRRHQSCQIHLKPLTRHESVLNLFVKQFIYREERQNWAQSKAK